MARASTPSSRPAKGATGTTDTAPKKVRWYTQVWTAYQMTRKHDPAITWLILAVFFGIVAIGLVVGLLVHSLVYMLVLSIPFAALGAMFVLARRATHRAGLRSGCRQPSPRASPARTWRPAPRTGC